MDHRFMPPGTSPVPSSQNKIAGRAYAERAAKTIFSRYPNPKAGPEYLVELANSLAEQPVWIVDRAADRHLGLTFKYKTFPPSIGEVIDYIGNLLDMKDRYDRYGEIQGRIQRGLSPPAQPFRPFPRLWEAFAGESDVIRALDAAESFDFLSGASKRFATKGKDAARMMILPPSTETAEPVDARETPPESAAA